MFKQLLAGKNYKTRLQNPHDEFWDRRLGVRTFGFRPATGSEASPDWQLHYTPAPYSGIFYALQHAGLNRDDVFTDLGSGMGRVVFAASWLGAAKAQGVEILPDLCEIADRNRQRSHIAKRDISFINGNARDVDIASTTLLFIFHSFGADTLEIVLRQFERTRSPRLRIIYMNPVYNDMLKSKAWLKSGRIIQPPKRTLSSTRSWPVAIWEAI